VCDSNGLDDDRSNSVAQWQRYPAAWKTLPKGYFNSLPVGSPIDGLPSGKRYVEQEFVLTL